MSSLSDQLRAELERDDTDLLKSMGRDVPGFSVFSDVSKRAITRLLRTAKLHFAGASPWQTGEEAVKEVGSHIYAPMVTHLVRTLAQGVQVGMEEEQDNPNYQELVKSDDFKIKYTVRALEYGLDGGCLGVIQKEAAQTVASFARHMGLRTATGKETAHVWDVWYAALGSCSCSMYMAGLRLGRKWREEEILRGILQATQSEVSE